MARPRPSAITKPWCHRRHAGGQVRHDDRARLQIPPFGGPGRLWTSPHVRAVQEHHPELDAAFPHQAEQPLPDTGPGPANEDLGGPPPRTQLLSGSPAFGPVWVPPGIADSVRCRSCGGVLALGRQASTRGSSSDHCASLSIVPPASERRKRKISQSVQATTRPTAWLSQWRPHAGNGFATTGMEVPEGRTAAPGVQAVARDADPIRRRATTAGRKKVIMACLRVPMLGIRGL